jgi:hypothetical protein
VEHGHRRAEQDREPGRQTEGSPGSGRQIGGDDDAVSPAPPPPTIRIRRLLIAPLRPK